MHHRTDVPPTEESYKPREWEKPHIRTSPARPAPINPPGSILTPEKRPEVTGDYEPWTPA